MASDNWFGWLETAAKRLFARGGAPMPRPGERAPDFDLADERGGRVRLADLAGRRAVLWFYPKAATPG